MAEDGVLEAILALHGQLLTVVEVLKEDREGRGQELLTRLPNHPVLETVSDKFKGLLEKEGRKKESRDKVLSGKINAFDEEYNLNREFQEIALQVADDLDLDEIEAAKLALAAEESEAEFGRPLRECANLLFHQQREYLLDCMRLLLDLAKEEDELLADEDSDDLGLLGQFVDQNILRKRQPGQPAPVAKDKFVRECMTTMGNIRVWLQKLIDQKTSATMLGRLEDWEFQEIADNTHDSLIRQHELLAVILCSAVERHLATQDDFLDFIRLLRSMDKYDFATGMSSNYAFSGCSFSKLTLIVHLFPVLGTYITLFGSTEGTGSVEQARQLNGIICQQSDDDPRPLPFLHAAIRAWWIAEYSGWYMEGAAGDGLPGVDVDAGKSSDI